jgi:hypothetical protein
VAFAEEQSGSVRRKSDAAKEIFVLLQKRNRRQVNSYITGCATGKCDLVENFITQALPQPTLFGFWNIDRNDDQLVRGIVIQQVDIQLALT